MKTKEEITVLISPRASWGPESTSFSFAVRGGAFCAVETYEVGDILVAGTGRKSMLGRVEAVETRPDGRQAVRISSLGISRGEAVAGHNLFRKTYELDLVPPHLLVDHDEGETLDGAFRSVVSGGDISVEIPDEARVVSTEYGKTTWREYRAERRRAEALERVREVAEAIRCLRNVLLEEREDPAFFERVYDKRGRAAWVMHISGERYHVVDHDDECPLLAAIEHQLYEASATA